MDKVPPYGSQLDPSKTTAGRPRKMSDSPERGAVTVDYSHAGLPPAQMNVGMGGHGIPVPAQGQQYLRNASNMPQQYAPPTVSFTGPSSIPTTATRQRDMSPPARNEVNLGGSFPPGTKAGATAGMLPRQRDMSPPARGPEPVQTTATRPREMSPARDSHGRAIQTDVTHQGTPAGLTGSRDPKSTANRSRKMSD